MGYGDRVYLEKVYDIDVGKRYIGDLVRNPLPEDYKSIKIGSYHGKLVKLKVEAQAINRDDEFALFWNLYDILIPNENGRIDVQLLTLPYGEELRLGDRSDGDGADRRPLQREARLRLGRPAVVPRLGMPEYEMSGA